MCWRKKETRCRLSQRPKGSLGRDGPVLCLRGPQCGGNIWFRASTCDWEGRARGRVGLDVRIWKGPRGHRGHGTDAEGHREGEDRARHPRAGEEPGGAAGPERRRGSCAGSCRPGCAPGRTAGPCRVRPASCESTRGGLGPARRRPPAPDAAPFGPSNPRTARPRPASEASPRRSVSAPASALPAAASLSCPPCGAAERGARAPERLEPAPAPARGGWTVVSGGTGRPGPRRRRAQSRGCSDDCAAPAPVRVWTGGPELGAPPQRVTRCPS